MNDPVIVDLLTSFFQKYPQRTYKKGSILIASLQEPEGVFFLTEGLVRRSVISESGQEATLNLYKPYSFFPMSWALNGTTSPHFYQALQKTQVWIAPKDDVLSFLEEHPDVVLDLLKRIYSGMEGLFMRMEYLLSGKAGSNVVIQLLILARRFRQHPKDTVVTLQITHSELAAQSGLARETVSRQLATLRKKNLLLYRNGVIEVNIPQLENYLLLI